mmetsp:Transcript_7375/g.27559  ORF Transcript_7375/g.27559 Transcript_7375/m.27559 type:complete len:382 (+) Transcript_7375:1385-2530(+)
MQISTMSRKKTQIHPFASSGFHQLSLLFVFCLCLIPHLHSESTTDPGQQILISPLSLLSQASNITYRWRQKIDFPLQPAVVNIWTRFHVIEQFKDEYLILQKTRLSWQNRNYLELEKDGRAPVIDWQNFGNVLNDAMCQNSPQALMFQKIKLEIGLERENLEQFCRNGRDDPRSCLVQDWQCGDVDTLVHLNRTTSSDEANEGNAHSEDDLSPVQTFLFKSKPSMPEYWKASQNNLKVTFHYQDEFVNGLHDRSDEIMRRVRSHGGSIVDVFRERVSKDQKQTTFEYDTWLHFRHVQRVHLPLGLGLKWYGYSNSFDKPLEAHSEWRVSSIMDIPLKEIIDNPHKFERDRTFAPESIVVNQPMTQDVNILKCEKQRKVMNK